MKHDYYIKSLNDLFENRSTRNPNYSWRALARDLGVDHAYLAHILKGNKQVTPKVAYKLAMTLGLKGEQLLEFIIPTMK